MNEFFKTDIFGHGTAAACIVVFGAIILLIFYTYVLRSLGMIFITYLQIHRRRRHLVIRMTNTIGALLCVILYLLVVLPMARKQWLSMRLSANYSNTEGFPADFYTDDNNNCPTKTESNTPAPVPASVKNLQQDRLDKAKLLEDLNSTDKQIRCNAIGLVTKHIYGEDNESLDLDRNILTALDRLTKSEDALERYLAEHALHCHVNQ